MIQFYSNNATYLHQ